MTSACPPQRWAARRQPERFAFNPETDTMVILPMLVWLSCRDQAAHVRERIRRPNRSTETSVELGMRIDRLDIRNFRCFGERAFSFHPQFTLLVGANASGRTAILEALTVAVGAALIPVPHAPNRPIHHRDVRRIYRPAGETGHFVEHYPARIEASGSFDGSEVEWARTLKSAKSRTTRGETRPIRDAMRALIRRGKDDDTVVLPCLGYYGTGRLWQEQRLTAAESARSNQPDGSHATAAIEIA